MLKSLSQQLRVAGLENGWVALLIALSFMLGLAVIWAVGGGLTYLAYGLWHSWITVTVGVIITFVVFAYAIWRFVVWCD